MIEFHLLAASDIETIVPMMEEFYAIDNYPFDAETTRKLFQTFIENENFGHCWFISVDAIVVGYVILTYIFSFEYQGQIAFLDELYLKKEARGKGIGKSTIEFIRNQAILKNLKLIYLEIESHNEVAKNLYLSNDYSLHNRQIMKHTTKP